ncbi:MAG: hypothetical protein ACP5NY_02810 [Thermocladium sp.]
MRLGQARIIEAVVATIIILVLAALMPVIFRSPTTVLRSQIQVGAENYAYNALTILSNNPGFLYAVQDGNWSMLSSLLNSIVGPQYDWYIAIVPFGKLSTLSVVKENNYVLLPINIVPNSYYSRLGLITLTSPTTALLQLNIYSLNSMIPMGYRINTTLPLANLAFIQCINPSLLLNITACIKQGQARLLSWQLQSFDNRTGAASIWINGTGVIYAVIPSNQNKPFNPLNNTVCRESYCLPIGGLSNLMAVVTNQAKYANDPNFLNQAIPNIKCLTTNPNGVNQEQNSIAISTSVYYVNEYNGALTTLNAPPSVSCMFRTSYNVNSSYGVNTYLDGQLVIAVPYSSFSVTLKNLQANLFICYSNKTPPCEIYKGNLNGVNWPLSFPISSTLSFYSSNETFIINNTNVLAETNLSNYYYSYLMQLSVTPDYAKCGLNVKSTIYNYITTDSRTLNYIYPLNVCNLFNQKNITSFSIIINVSKIEVSQATPENYYNGPNSVYNGVYYLYYTTSILYDLYSVRNPSVTYYLPSFLNYSFSLINKLNVVPMQFRERLPTPEFSPTAEANYVIQLPNGSYYLVVIGLSGINNG